MPVVVSDSFNRADAAVLGNAETGQAWTIGAAAFGITSNQAKRPSTTISHEPAWVNAGFVDGTVSAKATGPDSDFLG